MSLIIYVFSKRKSLFTSFLVLRGLFLEVNSMTIDKGRSEVYIFVFGHFLMVKVQMYYRLKITCRGKDERLKWNSYRKPHFVYINWT